MPPLDNPRWELFAQKIVEGLINGHREAYSQGRAYSAAGYIAKGDAADVNASRLLRKAKQVGERVQELQAEALARLERKLDVSRERVGRRLESVRKHQAGLQSFRSMRRIEASRRNASALRLRFSQSLASLRQRLSQAKVRSTTQRRGSTTNPFVRSERLTISISS